MFIFEINFNPLSDQSWSERRVRAWRSREPRDDDSPGPNEVPSFSPSTEGAGRTRIGGCCCLFLLRHQSRAATIDSHRRERPSYWPSSLSSPFFFFFFQREKFKRKGGKNKESGQKLIFPDTRRKKVKKFMFSKRIPLERVRKFLKVMENLVDLLFKKAAKCV